MLSGICTRSQRPTAFICSALLDSGVERIHRDTFHATLGLGRYALGLIWFKTLTGRDVAENPFRDFDEALTPAEIDLAKKCVAKIAAQYGL